MSQPRRASKGDQSQSAPGSPSIVPIEGARSRCIQELNEQYAVILLGNKTAVLRHAATSESTDDLRLLPVSDFHEWTRPIAFYEGSRRIQASKAWLESEKRRQYDGLVFDPSGRAPETYYNLWRGFAVEPNEAGSCQRFIDHIEQIVCCGDADLFQWVMGWFAAMVQRPTEKFGTSLVLRGGQGTGKTIVGQTIGSLLGPHYALVAESRYIVGRFNAHLANCLLLQLDEATWGGDHAAAGKLKDLITGEWQYIEYKGKEPVRVRNYVRLLVTGNNNWLVPAGLDERRFCVLDVSDAKKQDAGYFGALSNELKNGGRAKLLHYLLRYPIDDLPLRQVPGGRALDEQKVHSLGPQQQWWLDVLRRGRLPGDVDGLGECETDALYTHFQNDARARGLNRLPSFEQFGAEMRRLAPKVIKDRRSVATRHATTVRRQFYAFPTLQECRAAFNSLHGTSIDWRLNESDDGKSADESSWERDSAGPEKPWK